MAVTQLIVQTSIAVGDAGSITVGGVTTTVPAGQLWEIESASAYCDSTPASTSATTSRMHIYIETPSVAGGAIASGVDTNTSTQTGIRVVSGPCTAFPGEIVKAFLACPSNDLGGGTFYLTIRGIIHNHL